MKLKRLIKICFVSLLSMVLLISLLSGCLQKTDDKSTELNNSSETQMQETDKPSTEPETTTIEEPVKLVLMKDDGGRVHNDDNPIIAEIEKQTNTIIENNLIPSAEYTNKLNIIVASSDMPDILQIPGFDFIQYAQQGAFIELDEMIENSQNLLKWASPETYEKIRLNGKIYGIPTENYAGKYGFYFRKDWIEKVDATIPATLDDLYITLTKMKDYDQDVYPLGGFDKGAANFMPIFGAYGIMPIGGYGYTQLKGDKVYTDIISSEYKEALIYIKRLFDDKIADPEALISLQDQLREKLLQDKNGAFVGWWSIPQVVLVDQYKMSETIPGSEWIIVDPITGPEGKSGMQGMSNVGAMALISTSCENPDAAIRLLDFLSSDEGSKLAFLGIEGQHWTADGSGNFVSRTEEGTKAFEEKWLDEMSQYLSNTDLVMGIYKINNPTYAPYIDKCKDNPLIFDLFEGISTNEKQTLGGDMKQFEDESFISFVTGTRSIDEFDDYVNEWKQRGGEELRKSLLDEYNSMKDTEYTFGN